MTAPNPGLLNKNAAAEYLSTSDRRIDELRKSGALVAVQDGREWKFRRTDLDTYIEELPEYEPGRHIA